MSHATAKSFWPSPRQRPLARLPPPEARTPEPELTRRRTMWMTQAHSPTNSPLDDSTLRAVRTFVEEGAPEKAVNLLLSEGSYDSTDPAVRAKLRDLHPTAAPPPEGTGSQATTFDHQWHDLESRRDCLQVLERLIRDFPPASAADIGSTPTAPLGCPANGRTRRLTTTSYCPQPPCPTIRNRPYP
jgi:hypothetical protein